MSDKTIHLLYFSPTGTTRQIAHAIARGLGCEQPTETDLTYPKQREAPVRLGDDAIVVLAVPVYEERIPTLLEPWFDGLVASGQPVILVAVYGNIGFGITLQQLYQHAVRAGLRVVAAGSFIGEHSYSHVDLPVAAGRPDQADLKRAEQFGQQVAGKLTGSNPSLLAMDSIPGHLPPVAKILPPGSASIFVQAPAVDEQRCPGCKLCVRACPVAAIDPDTLQIDESRCLRCFACVRKCPKQARQIRLKKRLIVKTFLGAMGGRRREPMTYL